MVVDDKKLVCLIVPCLNEEQVIDQTHAAIARVLDDLVGYRALVYYIDDGSSDATLFRLKALARRDERVRVIALSRNFGQQAAIAAGLDLADRRADAVLVMDADLENPPELLPRMLDALEGGHEVVMAVRASARPVGLLKRLSSWGFYRVFNWLSELPIEPGAPDFFLLSRRAREAALRLPERARFWRGLSTWIGFARSYVSFEPPPRAAGRTKYTYRRMFRLASDALLAFSAAPLRLLLRLGALGLCAALALLALGVTRALTSSADPSFVLLAAVFVGAASLQLLGLGVIGMYLGRVFDELKGRPVYIVAEEIGEPVRAHERTLPVRVVRGGSSHV